MKDHLHAKVRLIYILIFIFVFTCCVFVLLLFLLLLFIFFLVFASVACAFFNFPRRLTFSVANLYLFWISHIVRDYYAFILLFLLFSLLSGGRDKFMRLYQFGSSNNNNINIGQSK